MQYLSSGAYEALRESGIIKLPSQRTLRDYTHHIEAAPGFSTDTDILLMKAAEIDVCPDRDRNVLLLIDEMYIKEGLVYDKHKGNFIGFCNLGSINQHLTAYEDAINKSHEAPAIAKTITVFMVRGLFTKLQFAYAQFPGNSVNGEMLFTPFWEAISRLESCDFKVIFIWDLCAGIHVRCSLTNFQWTK